MKQNKNLGSLLVLSASMLWGCIGIFVRIFNPLGLYSMEILAARTIFGLLFLSIYLLLFKRDKFRIRLRDLWCFIGVGVCNMTAGAFCYFTGMTMASLSVMSVLQYTGPIFVMLFGVVLFHERVTARKLIALALAFAGCCFAAGLGTDDYLSPQGLLLGLGSGLAYSMYSVFSRYAMNRGYDAWTILFWGFLCCGIASAPLTDWSAIGTAICADAGVLIPMALLGFLMGFLAYLLYSKGLQLIESGAAAVLSSTELVAATLAGTILYHEPLTLSTIIGIVLVLGGIAVLSLHAKEGKKQ